MFNTSDRSSTALSRVACPWLCMGIFLATSISFGQSAPVRVAPVESMVIAAGIELIGDVEPIRRSTVASLEPSGVVEFPHREGEFVKKGELLVQLDDAVVAWDLKAAQGTLAAIEQQLAEMKNGTRAEIVAAAAAKVRSAEAMKKLALQRKARTELLNRSSAASKEEHDIALAEVDRTEQEVQQFQSMYDEAKNGPRAEQIAQMAARVESQKATVDMLRTRLGRFRVTAPFTGFITMEHTQVGEWVPLGGPVVDMVELDEVDVRVSVPSEFAGKLKVGEDVRVELAAARDRLLVGKLVQIIPETDRKSRLFPVKVRLKNEIVDGMPLLKAGMLAKASMPIGNSQPALVVPKDALVLGEREPFVYVVRPSASGPPGSPPDPKKLAAMPTVVFVGATANGKVEVRGSLQPGDLVVVQGNERLRPGQSVTIVE